jgi:hypothetical protein
MALQNPGVPGRYKFRTFVYAASGLNYSAVPDLSQYQIFDAPHPEYVTGRIDISAFAQFGLFTPWPFSPIDAPLNGHVSVPKGKGPFPLAVFAHGNHDPLENSTPGYLYLCELFASHGIIAATIDVNFLNGFNFGENDGRAIVHLEHVKQFRTWSNSPQHPLYRKVDLRRILLIGHSRGGEGVGHASLFNTLNSIQPDIFSPVLPLDGSAGLGPYGFRLSGAAAIAPTDRQYEPIAGPTVVRDRYYLIHGSRDGDVSSFEGYNTYNRAHAVDLANPTISDGKLKALLWVTTTISSTPRGHRKPHRRSQCLDRIRNRSPRFTSELSPRHCCCADGATWTSCGTTESQMHGYPPEPTWCPNTKTRIGCS